MKSILTVLLMLSFYSLKAQQSVVYFAQPELNKFAGKWVYLSGDTSLMVNLKVEKTDLKNNNAYIDVIKGDYTFKIGNRVIISTLGKPYAINAGGFVDKNVSDTKISFLFNDFSTSKKGRVIFELIGDLRKAKWTLNAREDFRLVKMDYDFSVPRKAVMTKVE